MSETTKTTAPSLAELIGARPGVMARRSGRALAAVITYAAKWGDAEPTTPDGVADDIEDMLSDLRHLADSLGLSFDGLDEVAQRRYAEEI